MRVQVSAIASSPSSGSDNAHGGWAYGLHKAQGNTPTEARGGVNYLVHRAVSALLSIYVR
jgi:hypothetical protein